jgi:hypothetical protein
MLQKRENGLNLAARPSEFVTQNTRVRRFDLSGDPDAASQ